MKRYHSVWITILLLAGCVQVQHPGLLPDGKTLLPNNWRLSPAGKQIPVGDLPLGMAATSDGKWLYVTNNGYSDQYVSVINLQAEKEVARIPMRQSWLGIALNHSNNRLYISGGGDDIVEVQSLNDGRPTHLRAIRVKAADDATRYFVSGIAVSRDEHWLYVCALRQSKLLAIDLTEPDKPPVAIDTGAYPYTVVLDEAHDRGYVSNWGGSSVSVIDLAKQTEIKKIPVGALPNAMALSSDGRLFVTSANANQLSIIDTRLERVTQVLDLSPYRGAPQSGSEPNGLALSKDGSTLYLANADNNSVSVVDVTGQVARITGAIPTGWYPTALTLTNNDRTLLVANGKGLSSKANPNGPTPQHYKSAPGYIGRILLGTVSVVDVPDQAQLETYTREVAENNGLDLMAGKLARGTSQVQPRAIPRHLGEPSPIKHVFYILKENRSYDQVLGDMKEGEGDPSLTIFGEKVTPNHHALARQFVLFDNFYVDAEVSMDGHSWSMGAIATDFNEKLWPTTYSRQSFPAPLYLPVSWPSTGFLWDAAARAGLSYRSYGEFTQRGERGTFSPVPRLVGHVSHDYPSMNLRITDNKRADIFIRELHEQIKNNAVPALSILSLPCDHTMGTYPGAPTPRAMVADNDLALGRIIEAISTSPIWKESVVLVIEDDAQSGPDHIDAHRSVMLVASPYAKRGYVDHTMYDTVSMLRTLELILGLPPMSQYDAAAVPMFNAFTNKADLSPYRAKPNTWPLNERNTPKSPNAQLSRTLDFRTVDSVPDQLLNRIIWQSVRGAGSVVPVSHTTRNWHRPESPDPD